MRRVGAVLLLKPILSLALTMHHIASRRVVRAAARAAGPRKAAREPCVVEDVEGLCGAYDTILLDQFGVVHDGKVPYDGAPELVRRLQRAGKRVVVLSHSSKRRRDTIARLAGRGCGAASATALSTPSRRVPSTARQSPALATHKVPPRK